MKKVLLFLLQLVIFTACNTEQSKFGIGGQHACQFVKEQVPELREDISNVEVIGEDSMICDIGLSFGFNRVLEAEMMYYDGKITRSELDHILDSMNHELHLWKIRGNMVSLRLMVISLMDNGERFILCG